MAAKALKNTRNMVQLLRTMYLLTEWEGRTGKYLARGQGVRPDLTQSISILSYENAA